jgi:hypothetical protein
MSVFQRVGPREVNDKTLEPPRMDHCKLRNVLCLELRGIQLADVVKPVIDIMANFVIVLAAASMYIAYCCVKHIPVEMPSFG